MDPIWGVLEYRYAPEMEPVPLSCATVRMGRHPSCEVIFKHSAVSAVHCVVGIGDEGDVYVEDISTNGTFVDGKRVEKRRRVLVQDGACLSLIKPDNKKNLKHPEWEPMSWNVRLKVHIPTSRHTPSPSVEDKPSSSNKTQRGWRLRDEYDIVRELGGGSFGEVRLARHVETGELFAIKCLDRAKMLRSMRKGRKVLDGAAHRKLQDEYQAQWRQEASIICRLDHPHVVQVHDVKEGPRYLFIILEYVPNGDLFSLLERRAPMKEREAARIFWQLCEAVTYLHSKGIIHRDLKPENILVTESGDMKLSDFGLSRMLPSSDQRDGVFMTTVCGTGAYIAPEVILVSRGEAEGYTPAVDMWSLGVCLYAMLSNRLPFPSAGQDGAARGGGTADVAMFSAILQGRYSLEGRAWSRVSDSAKNLIRGLLSVNPKQRLSIEQTMAHPWLELATSEQ